MCVYFFIYMNFSAWEINANKLHLMRMFDVDKCTMDSARCHNIGVYSGMSQYPSPFLLFFNR